MVPGALELECKMTSPRDGQFQIKPAPLIGQYGRQRFRQFGPEDSANWYVVKGDQTKRPFAMYPTLGRAHINYVGYNQLVFGSEPRGEFKSIKYGYIVVGNQIFRIDSQYTIVNITAAVPLLSFNTPVYFSFLVVNTTVFSCFVDDQKIYVYQEDTETFSIVTDPNAPGNVTLNGVIQKPGFIATFGNRITVSVAGSSQFFLSQPNLLTPNRGAGQTAQFQPFFAFTVGTVLNYVPPAPIAIDVAGAAVFAQEGGIIQQMGVLNNTLYIFTDYTTGIWSNIPAVFSGTGVSFPWKKSSTYDWNYGLANSESLDIDFGRMVFLARNTNGLLQFMMSYGDQPQVISSKAVDTLLQRYTNLYGANNPFTVKNSNGFLYQYEDTIFYRMAGGPYTGTGILDQEENANSIEFCFENNTWHRCIELNGERNRVKYHLYFNFKHLVTVIGENTVYDMSGQYYFNESRNPDQQNPQATDAYIAYPFRYERISPIISEPDYSEFETEYVEIDFVFGDSNINYSNEPFSTVQFIIDEQSLNGEPQYMIAENPGADGNPVYMITDGSSNDPAIDEKTYNKFFKPSIELWYSDDGGVSFNSADIRQFSQMGIYQWRMRWYQLGPSRNRAYKLICVSPVPIVVLGAVMNVRRISGGAN